jgi:hypothetical protein
MSDIKKEGNFSAKEAQLRFERAVDIALHTPARHKTKTEKKPVKKATKAKKV